MSNSCRSEVLRYFLRIYFGDDRNKMSDATGYTKHQIGNWVEDVNQPNESTIEWVAHCALAPEFKIIIEFGPIEANGKPRLRKQQIKEMLHPHEEERGIYAFYDGSASLIYIGKTEATLLEEIYQSINQKINTNFSLKRWNIVRYISAYYIGGTSSFDYPKHVESLMLRISRPRLNNNIGQLEQLPSKASA